MIASQELSKVTLNQIWLKKNFECQIHEPILDSLNLFEKKDE